MGQIVKRKKKGRPSKADLALRSAAAADSEPRRSLRRRNTRYSFDYDDYLDDEDEYEEAEEVMRREKKLKLMVKLNQSADLTTPMRGRHAMDDGEEDARADEEDGDESERKPVKKRRINGDDYGEDEVDEDDEEEDEERDKKGGAKGHDSYPGTPDDSLLASTPLPDKKSVELILDKLQKKDMYGVYAEPVDPEELPDYYDIIEHPMDFSTVRKKLSNGSYSTLQELVSDIFLICSNAMQYNSTGTVYHKQARTILELARRKFEKLRIKIARVGKELKPEQKFKSNLLTKKPTKKVYNQQEPVASNFFSVPALATAGNISNCTVTAQSRGCERSNISDGAGEANLYLTENFLEKAEEISSGRGFLPKFGRRLSSIDDNRRTTYNISDIPVNRSESIFTTFEDEAKELVAVGLHAEYSYARSLARFAATLGPVAWNVASQRIEQALPADCKFGRGWVGEYEPLPTPVLMVDTRTEKKSSMFTRWRSTADVQVDSSVFSKVAPVSRLQSEKTAFFLPGPTTSKGKPPSLSSVQDSCIPVNVVGQQQNPHSRTFLEPHNKVSKQVELNFPPSASQDTSHLLSEKQNMSRGETVTAGVTKDAQRRNMNLWQSAPPKQQESNGCGELPNGKVAVNGLNNRMAGPSSDGVPSQMSRAVSHFAHKEGKGLTDPVQLMRMLTEKAQMQQTPSGEPPQGHLSSAVMPSALSTKRDSSSDAAVAAARAWMSLGAGGYRQAPENSSSPRNQISAESLYNPTRELESQLLRVRGEFPTSGMPFHTERNNNPLQPVAREPTNAENEAKFQNRPMGMPQLVTADLSRFQVQPSWHGLNPHIQSKQRQETFPPDLNIGFHSPGSPMKQSGVLADSQQPDLALQL